MGKFHEIDLIFYGRAVNTSAQGSTWCSTLQILNFPAGEPNLTFGVGALPPLKAKSIPSARPKAPRSAALHPYPSLQESLANAALINTSDTKFKP